MTRGQATTNENKKAVESQLIAVSETSKYAAAEADTGAKVSHYRKSISV